MVSFVKLLLCLKTFFPPFSCHLVHTNTNVEFVATLWPNIRITSYQKVHAHLKKCMSLIRRDLFMLIRITQQV